MSDRLSQLLWVDVNDKPAPPERRVEEALKKALDATTPERPGVPWDETEKTNEQGGWKLPGDEDNLA